MNITWAQNPLATTIELDEREKREFWLMLKIEELKDRLIAVHVYLQEGQFFDLNKARKAVEQVDSDESLDARVNQLHSWHLEALAGSHGGDCTCDPCSCPKCIAENILGIDTIAGLKKHEANKIESAFRRGKTLSKTIEELANYAPESCWPGAEAHFERWRQEAKNAHDWLVKYRDEHFPI